nr:reverse transcriptase domain-containing protein [Tanacetum cinerariifolium]
MVRPIEKRSSNKLCDFHNDKGHSTDECMQLKKQIEELVRAGKLSHLIKEIKQGREQPKTGIKEAAATDKPTTIYMVRSWQRTVKQKVTQSFEPGKEIAFPPLTTNSGTEGPLIIEAEIGGHIIHRMYVDGGSSMEILYEHCFNRVRPEIKSQMVPATTSLTGFSGETTWPLGQLRLLVTIGDATHSTKAWMNFMPSDMTGVPRSVAEHRLNIREGCPPVRQKKREEDEEKTAFHTGQGVYCYTKMPFGLKNARATYQRLMDKAFESQMGRNIEVYVDDLVVKIHTEAKMVRDIEETFQTLCKINMKLNPKKCSFGLAEGVFLGYVITPEGIKPCSDKTTAVLQLPSPQTIKEVQNLNGKLASLNRFLSKSAEKSLSLFQTLKKCIRKSEFRWTAEAEQAFQQLKQHLSDLPLLVAPKPQEELIMYLSATHGAISAVLMTERGMAQTPIYFISRALQGPQLNYSPMEKLVLSLVLQQKDFEDIFRHILSRSLLTSPSSRPRMSIKGQILADFLNEIPGNASQGVPVAVTQEEPWTLFTDGSSCVDGSGAGLILTNPEGVEFIYALRFQFSASNNEADYEALVAGLRIATQMGVKNVQANVDSKLVANQVLGTYVAKEDNMIKYLEIVKGLVCGFTTFSISQVPRSRNKKADALSKIASTSFAHLSKQVLVEVLETKSTTRKEVTAVIEEEGPTWMTELVNYLKEGILRGDEKEARKLCLKARQYELMEGILYKRSFLTPWLRCVGPLQAEYVMREIHEGSCSMHAGPRSLSGRAGEGQVPDSRNGLLHEMDRSKGGGNDYRWAVIPAEIGMPTYRTAAVDAVNNDKELRLNLDLLEERQELAAMSEAKSKSKMMKYYNAKVRGVAFKPVDFVYRSNDASHTVAGGKLGPK